jgi:prefoldin beta subunit
VAKLKKCGNDIQELMGPRAQYIGQKNENDLVKKELGLLEDDAVLYKLVGPVMIKQDLDEAKQNVDNRIKYFTGELGRLDTRQKELEDQQEKQRSTLVELQEVVRATQQAYVKQQMEQQKQQAVAAAQ